MNRYLAPTPAHALTEGNSAYSIVFNMLGMEQQDVGIDVNVETREVTVLARKETELLRRGFFWIFGIPADASLLGIRAKFRAGVLEIEIPRRLDAAVA